MFLLAALHPVLPLKVALCAVVMKCRRRNGPASLLTIANSQRWRRTAVWLRSCPPSSGDAAVVGRAGVRHTHWHIAAVDLERGRPHYQPTHRAHRAHLAVTYRQLPASGILKLAVTYRDVY